MATTVVSFYDEFAAAQSAVTDLVDNGFTRDDISLLANNVTGEHTHHAYLDREHPTHREAAGLGAGALGGGLGGLLLGLGVFAVPGVGPALAAGPLATMLAGAGVGAAAGGLAGMLLDLGIPDQEAGYYAEGVRRGGTLVVVKTSEDSANQAAAILSRHDPVDIDQRVAHWREQGWSGYDPQADPYTPEEIARARAASRQAGTARAVGASGFSAFAADFRQHYETYLANSGYSYEQLEPSYRYGYTLGSDEFYRNRDWHTVEADVRRNWEEHQVINWEYFQEAVRYAWDRARREH